MKQIFIKSQRVLFWAIISYFFVLTGCQEDKRSEIRLVHEERIYFSINTIDTIQITYQYDSEGRLESINGYSPDNMDLSYENGKVSEISYNLELYSLVYNEKEQLTKITVTVNNYTSYEFFYEDDDLLPDSMITESTPIGHGWTYTYDEHNNIIQSSYDLSHTDFKGTLTYDTEYNPYQSFPLAWKLFRMKNTGDNNLIRQSYFDSFGLTETINENHFTV